MEREMPLVNWMVPNRIELDTVNDHLIYWPGGHEVGDAQGVLTDFVALAGATDERILEYARQWGVMEFCIHEHPRSHHPHPVSVGYQMRLMSGCSRVQHISAPYQGEDNFGPWVEPLERWRFYAAKIKAIVHLDDLMRNGARGAHDDWMIALSQRDDDSPYMGPDWTGSPWELAREVGQLLEIANIRPLFHWMGDRRYQIQLGMPELGGESVFGPIVMNLAMALSRSEGLVMCTGCGIAFSASESKPTGTNRFCKSCRESGIADRVRKRQSRQRQKAEKAS